MGSGDTGIAQSMIQVNSQVVVVYIVIATAGCMDEK